MASPEDRSALRDLVEAYALAADAKDYEAIADCFTEGGRLVLFYDPEAAEPTAVRQGRAEILEAMGNLARFTATSHLVGAHAARVEGDGATGTTTCVASHVSVKGESRRMLTMGIRYDDTFVRTEGGWRLEERRLVTLWQELRPMEG